MTSRIDLQAERAERRTRAIAELTSNDISFRSSDNGNHIIIESGAATYDFWPCTGHWRNRANCRQGNGVQSLISTLSAQSTLSSQSAQGTKEPRQ